MRALGLDWGEQRIGVAVSDPLGMTALPLEHVHNDDGLIAALKGTIEKYSADTIVLGLPKNMDGSEGASAAKVKDLKDKLEVTLGITVKLWDERLTTKMAERVLIDSGVSRGKRKGIVDSISAAMMLQSYMDSIK